MIRRIPQSQIIFTAPNNQKETKNSPNEFITSRIPKPTQMQMNALPPKQNPFVSKLSNNITEIKNYFKNITASDN